MLTRPVLTLLCFLLSGSWLAAAPISIFNTGVKSDGSLEPLGSTDPHYQLLNYVPPPGQPTVAVGPAAFTVYNNIWLADGPNSNWIGPTTDPNATEPAGTYTYTTTFSLAGFDATTAQLSGRWSTDNEGIDILLNGVGTGNFIPDGTAYQSFTNFSITSLFRPGTNTLSFVVHNDASDGINPDPTGLRVEISGTADPLGGQTGIPEPNSLFLALLGLPGYWLALRFARATTRA